MNDFVKQQPYRLPRVIPVFPLPNTTLFPGVDLALHIFEARYQKMLADTLKGSKCIGVSLMKKGWEKKKEPYPSHTIIGAGFVRAAVENSDGTSNIILHGIARVQVEKYLHWEPYRLAVVREIDDEWSSESQIQRLNNELKSLFIKKLRFLSEKPQQELMVLDQLSNPAILANLVAYTSNVNCYTKQKVLETRRIVTRLRKSVRILKSELLPLESLN